MCTERCKEKFLVSFVSALVQWFLGFHKVLFSSFYHFCINSIVIFKFWSSLKILTLVSWYAELICRMRIWPDTQTFVMDQCWQHNPDPLLKLTLTCTVKKTICLPTLKHWNCTENEQHVNRGTLNSSFSEWYIVGEQSKDSCVWQTLAEH